MGRADTLYYLDANIGNSTTPVTQMVAATFSGTFVGNGHKIYAQINSNTTNVGLFSTLNNAEIYNLIIDGTITGGDSSQFVGGLAGTISNSSIHLCHNLANVTGGGTFSSVGGIAGEINGLSFIVGCTNKGTITGGQYVAGITGIISG